MTTVLREARDDELEAVHALVAEVFAADGEADLVVALIRDGDAWLSLVAEVDGRLAGHLMLSTMQAPLRALALAPVAVTPGLQAKGLGAALIREAIDRAQQNGWQAIFVLGAPAYYRRFGFDADLARGFTSPYSGEAFMALALQPPLSPLTGELKHAPAFAGLD